MDHTDYRAPGRNSVEELNQEIELLVLEDHHTHFGIPDSTPEGHRAPIAELFTRSVSTQTPYSLDSDEFEDDDLMYHHNMLHEDVSSSSSRDSAISDDDDLLADGNRCPSSVDYSSPVHMFAEVGNNSNKRSKSRRPGVVHKILTREPPDGCEKIRTVNEDQIRHSAAARRDIVFGPCPQKSGFVLLPSQSSAFLPIVQVKSGTWNVEK